MVYSAAVSGLIWSLHPRSDAPRSLRLACRWSECPRLLHNSQCAPIRPLRTGPNTTSLFMGRYEPRRRLLKTANIRPQEECSSAALSRVQQLQPLLRAPRSHGASIAARIDLIASRASHGRTRAISGDARARRTSGHLSPRRRFQPRRLSSSRLLLLSMPLVTVRAHDARIEYFGSRWKDDLFEIRPGIDPPGAGGVNGTSDGGVCALGVASRETWGFGNGFRLAFTGVGVRLIMESRQDHGIYVVDLDGTQSTVSGYSDAPHCGAAFVADGLPLAEHTVSATLMAQSPASTWDYSYMQLFAIQYDSGSSSNTTGQTPHSSSPSRTPPAVLRAQKAFTAGAIAGVTLAGFVAAFALVVLVVWLFRRRRKGFSAVPAYDASEKATRMRRGKGRRRSVLSDVPSPYMLHHGASASSLGASPSPSAGSPPAPDYAPHDPSVSPYPIVPSAAPTKSRGGYGASPVERSPSYQPSPSSGSEKAPPLEEGGTMLPPYTGRSN